MKPSQIFFFLFFACIAARADINDAVDSDVLWDDEVLDVEIPHRFELQPFDKPDLIVSNISAPVYMGNTYHVQVTVRNIGRAVAPASTLAFRDNQNQSHQNKAIPRLGFKQSATVTAYVSAPENQGPWYFSAIADYGNKVSEMNEGNNVKNFYQ